MVNSPITISSASNWPRYIYVRLCGSLAGDILISINLFGRSQWVGFSAAADAARLAAHIMVAHKQMRYDSVWVSRARSNRLMIWKQAELVEFRLLAQWIEASMPPYLSWSNLATCSLSRVPRVSCRPLRLAESCKLHCNAFDWVQSLGCNQWMGNNDTIVGRFVVFLQVFFQLFLIDLLWFNSISPGLICMLGKARARSDCLSIESVYFSLKQWVCVWA